MPAYSPDKLCFIWYWTMGSLFSRKCLQRQQMRLSRNGITGRSGPAALAALNVISTVFDGSRKQLVGGFLTGKVFIRLDSSGELSHAWRPSAGPGAGRFQVWATRDQGKCFSLLLVVPQAGVDEWTCDCEYVTEHEGGDGCSGRAIVRGNQQEAWRMEPLTTPGL